MKLFHWPMSVACKLYGHGNIVVMAEDVHVARVVALQAAETAELAYDDMAELARRMNGPDSDWAQDSAEEFARRLDLLRTDLAREPLVYEGDKAALFFNGSE